MMIQKCTMQKRRTCHIFAVLILSCVLAACTCERDHSNTRMAPQNLLSATDTVAHLLDPNNLERSGFAVIFPDGKPSDYVSYFFSQMGKSEWPVADEIQTTGSISPNPSVVPGVSFLPKDVALIPYHPDPEKTLQVVLKADDLNNFIVIEAYQNAASAPVISKNIELPKVTPDPSIRLLVQDNLSMGMSYQYSPPKMEDDAIDDLEIETSPDQNDELSE